MPLANGSQNQRTCSDQPLFLIDLSLFSEKFGKIGISLGTVH
jgi:hypothetical protein